MPPADDKGTKLHQHVDTTSNGKCDICQVELCPAQDAQGAQNLMCSRVMGHKGEHYDRKQKVHF